jgi:hypothetical protein
MQPALANLKRIIEDAEQKAQSAQLKEALQQAEEEWKQAQKSYEEAMQGLNQAQEECGNPIDRLQADRTEYDALKERATQVESFIDTEDINSLFKDVEDQIEDQFIADKERIDHAQAEVQVMRDKADQTHSHFQSLQQQYQLAIPGNDHGSLAPRMAVEILVKDIDIGLPELTSWVEEARHELLCVWLGKARKLQDTAGLTDQEQEILRNQVFGRLNAVSKTHTSQFIEALNRDFVTNWDMYIKEHQDRYNERCAQYKELEARKKDQQELEIEDQQRRRQARTKSTSYMGTLTDLCGKESTAQNDESIVELVEILLNDVRIEPSNSELVDLLYPLRDLFKNRGAIFRPLRRAFHGYESRLNSEVFKEEQGSVIDLTRGKRAVIIGGAPREENRLTLLNFFEWDELQWESCQGKEPRILDRIEQSIRSGGVDMVLELTSLVGHHVEKLKPVCEDTGIPFVRVARGYGVSGLIDSIRTHNFGVQTATANE